MTAISVFLLLSFFIGSNVATYKVAKEKGEKKCSLEVKKLKEKNKHYLDLPNNAY